MNLSLIFIVNQLKNKHQSLKLPASYCKGNQSQPKHQVNSINCRAFRMGCEKIMYLLYYAHVPAGEVPEHVSTPVQAAPVVPHTHVLDVQVFDVPEQASAVSQ